MKTTTTTKKVKISDITRQLFTKSTTVLYKTDFTGQFNTFVNCYPGNLSKGSWLQTHTNKSLKGSLLQYIHTPEDARRNFKAVATIQIQTHGDQSSLETKQPRGLHDDASLANALQVGRFWVWQAHWRTLLRSSMDLTWSDAAPKMRTKNMEDHQQIWPFTSRS